MKNYLKFVFVFVSVAFALSGCGCDDVEITIYTGPAHLTITNLETGVSKENNSTLQIPSPEYHLTAQCGDRIEMRFTPMEKYADKKFDVKFKFLDQESKVSSSPYSKTVVIPSDTPEGIYSVECSAMCEVWDNGSSCTQSMRVKVEKQ